MSAALQPWQMDLPPDVRALEALQPGEQDLVMDGWIWLRYRRSTCCSLALCLDLGYSLDHASPLSEGFLDILYPAAAVRR